MIVAIAGATGLTGTACLRMLVDDPRVTKVLAIGRSPVSFQHAKINEITLPLPDPAPPIQADAFICCLGTTLRKAGSAEAFKAIDYLLPLQLAGWLLANGCRTMSVVSAMGANSKSLVLYNRVKGELEQDLRKMGFGSLHILRPSFIIGHRKENRPLESLGKVLFKILDPIFKNGFVHFRSIPDHVLAAGLIGAIMQPANGTFVYLSAQIPGLANYWEAGLQPIDEAIH